MNKPLFEISFYKDEYSKKPLAVCEPDFEAFCSTLKSVSKKQVNEKRLPEYFEKVCKETSQFLKRKLENGIVVCIGIREDATQEEIEEYNASTSNPLEIAGSFEKPQKRAYHRKTPEEKAAIAKAKASKKGKRGRPKGSKNKSKAKKPVKKARGKVGRPALPKAEKERRAKAKAAAYKRSGGKRGRPKGSKNKVKARGKKRAGR